MIPRTSDYRGLPAGVHSELEKRAARINEILKGSVLEIGRELIEAKKLLTHGEFGRWIEREVGVSRRWAQLVMRAYQLCLKYENFSHLQRSALFRLLGPDVSTSTLNKISEMIGSGRVPKFVEIEDVIRRSRREAPNTGRVTLFAKRSVRKTAEVIDFIDLDFRRSVKKIDAKRASLAEPVARFSDDANVTDVAVMLTALLDYGQISELVSIIRKVQPETPLLALATALEVI